MKIIFLLIYLFTTLTARENPFEATFKAPKTFPNTIPLLHITTNKIFETHTEPTPTKIIKVLKKTTPPSFDKPLLPPIMIEEEPTPIKTYEIKEPIYKTKKYIKKKKSYKTIYQNYFLKLQSNHKNFKIFTQDKLLQKTRFTQPQRIALDFKRLQYFHTKSITLNNPYTKKIKLGTHHDFYRITLTLHNNKHYKLAKKPYGYLLTLY